MAHPVFGRGAHNARDVSEREERIGEQAMEHVGHDHHMSEHMGRLPAVMQRRKF